MRLIFATSLIPRGAPATGYEHANRAVLARLAALGHDVVPFGFVEAGKTGSLPAGSIVLGEADLVTAGAPAARKVAWLANAVRHNTTFAGAKLMLQGADVVAARLAAAAPFDAVIINGVTLASAYEDLLTSWRFIHLAHNVEHVSAREAGRAAKSQVERTLYGREARFLQALEQRLIRRAAFVWTLSDDDRAAFGLAASDRAATLPLSVSSTIAALPPRHVDCDATLIGTWTWAPNRIGLDWFLEEVVPHLPDTFTFRIAGRTPDDVVLRHPGGRLVGRVPDATDFVRSGAVVPLVARAGTGVQLKSIETFELGLPSVATSQSLRGIPTPPGNCRCEDDPRAFAAALVQAAAEVKAGRLRDEDGAAFARRQVDALDAALAKGLVSLANRDSAAAA